MTRLRGAAKRAAEAKAERERLAAEAEGAQQQLDSPTATPVVTVPATVPTSAGVDARVELAGDRIKFTWTTSCGVRCFTPEDLQQRVAWLEQVAAFGDDVWLETADSEGAGFAVRLADGTFYADASIHPSAPSAPWEAIKAACLAAATPQPAQAPADPREEEGQVMT